MSEAASTSIMWPLEKQVNDAMERFRTHSIEIAVVDFILHKATCSGKIKQYIEEFSIVDAITMNARHWVFGETDISGMYPVGVESAKFRHITYHIYRFHFASTMMFALTAEKCHILQEMFFRRPVYDLSKFGLGESFCENDGSLQAADDQLRCSNHVTTTKSKECSLSNALAAARRCSDNLEKIDVRNVAVRQSTFIDWPSDAPSPKTMAENGFVALDSPTDRTHTMCVYCGGNFVGWKKEDDVFADHKRYSPRCSFVEHVKKHGFGIEVVEFLKMQVG